MTGDGSRWWLRACVPLLGVALLVGSAPKSSPTPSLADARAQLEDLTGRIAQQASAVDELRGLVAIADERIENAERALGLIMSKRLTVRRELEDARAAYADALSRLHDAVVDAFMASPGGLADADVLGAFLGADSMGDLQDRLAFSDAIVADRQSSTEELTRARMVLDTRARALDGAIAAQRATVESLRQARDEKVAALDQQQTALADLSSTRDRIVHLIAGLEGQLDGEDVGAVARAFQGADHVAYGDWADMLLKILGAPTCRQNQVLVVAWQVQEFTQAAWNPLATTHRMPGSTSFNSVGVQNFVSLAQGLQATKETIEHGWSVYGYGAIVSSLRACASALATAHAIAASSWCPGCLGGNYVVGVVPRVEADFETYASI
jgi:uncharacterized coiled-coil protein SlyX